MIESQRTEIAALSKKTLQLLEDKAAVVAKLRPLEQEQAELRQKVKNGAEETGRLQKLLKTAQQERSREKVLREQATEQLEAEKQQQKSEAAERRRADETLQEELEVQQRRDAGADGQHREERESWQQRTKELKAENTALDRKVANLNRLQAETQDILRTVEQERNTFRTRGEEAEKDWVSYAIRVPAIQSEQQLAGVTGSGTASIHPAADQGGPTI